MSVLDRTDLRLLAVLQSEGRITNAELAERVNLSPSACLRRLQRLEADKVVTGYAAQVDPQAVGLGLQAFVRVQLVKHEADVIERFVERVAGSVNIGLAIVLIAVGVIRPALRARIRARHVERRLRS